VLGRSTIELLFRQATHSTVCVNVVIHFEPSRRQRKTRYHQTILQSPNSRGYSSLNRITMSEFNGRRAPNFSQYLDDLNAIPSPYDQAVQQQQKQDSFNLDAELSLFTNAEFFDFDQFGELNLPTFDSVDNDKLKDNSNSAEQNADLKFLDFLNGE
jgi:hypothetical protein